MVIVLNKIKKSLILLFFIPIIGLNTSFAQTQYMSPQLAFTPVVTTGKVSIKIAPTYYLYKSRIQVQNSNTGKPIKFTYQTTPIVKKFKDVPDPQTVFVDHVDLKINAPVNTKIKLIYQGCSTQGLCYPPQRQELVLK